jgi:hypothetical protein
MTSRRESTAGTPAGHQTVVGRGGFRSWLWLRR